jgi:hypothetical protein
MLLLVDSCLASCLHACLHFCHILSYYYYYLLLSCPNHREQVLSLSLLFVVFFFSYNPSLYLLLRFLISFSFSVSTSPSPSPIFPFPSSYLPPISSSSCSLRPCQAVTCRLLSAETRVQSRGSSCGSCGAESGTRAGFSPNTSVSP